ncbi:MAG TPA: ABC transporter ATP-binding protein [Tepidisphaeraceae bacterium]|jgi:sodium transport system ATP-binding protein|nr:ABC transporter ATP-binding protein [Tepidisphaeraceae bacterium]
MVEVRGLTKSYDEPNGGQLVAVGNANLSCNAGEIYGLLGPNGAGKTTTLRCLATVLKPTAGTATVAGFDLLQHPEDVRRNIGFLSGTTGLYQRLTPRETVRFFGELYGLAGDQLEARVETVLQLFRITEYADRANDRLSTGMKQRVGLARAVVHDPPVVILDEPTSGLDPIVTRDVEDAITALARAGRCVLLSTHSLSQAEDLCAKIGVIAHGKVLAEGTPAELCASTQTPNLRKAFFNLIEMYDPLSVTASPGLSEDRGRA